MGNFSVLFRMVIRSTPPIFSFLLIFSNLFPISTGLIIRQCIKSSVNCSVHVVKVKTLRYDKKINARSKTGEY